MILLGASNIYNRRRGNSTDRADAYRQLWAAYATKHQGVVGTSTCQPDWQCRDSKAYKSSGSNAGYDQHLSFKKSTGTALSDGDDSSILHDNSGQYEQVEATSCSMERVECYNALRLVNPGPLLVLEPEDGTNSYYWTDNSNNFRTSTAEVTSSVRYKTDVETIEEAYSSKVLDLRPVWYRSLSEADPNELVILRTDCRRSGGNCAAKTC